MLHPDDYAGGTEPPDGGMKKSDGRLVGWEILGEEYETNPRLRLSSDDWEMVRIWQLCSAEGGPGHLPDSGGVLDQPAVMMDAFDVMRRAERQLTKRGGGCG